MIYSDHNFCRCPLWRSKKSPVHRLSVELLTFAVLEDYGIHNFLERQCSVTYVTSDIIPHEQKIGLIKILGIPTLKPLKIYKFGNHRLKISYCNLKYFLSYIPISPKPIKRFCSSFQDLSD